jgi:hypothetical protein
VGIRLLKSPIDRNKLVSVLYDKTKTIKFPSVKELALKILTAPFGVPLKNDTETLQCCESVDLMYKLAGLDITPTIGMTTRVFAQQDSKYFGVPIHPQGFCPPTILKMFKKPAPSKPS